MSLHPELVTFQRRLETTGVVVAVHADHLCVRLPLLASVRVRYDGARLAFDPRFGTSSRTMATASALLGSTAAVAVLVFSGVGLPIVVGVGVLAVLGSAYDTMRYVVTESAITRVALLWAGRPSIDSVAALGTGPARPLHADASLETVQARLHVE